MGRPGRTFRQCDGVPCKCRTLSNYTVVTGAAVGGVHCRYVVWVGKAGSNHLPRGLIREEWHSAGITNPKTPVVRVTALSLRWGRHCRSVSPAAYSHRRVVRLIEDPLTFTICVLWIRMLEALTSVHEARLTGMQIEEVSPADFSSCRMSRTYCRSSDLCSMYF